MDMQGGILRSFNLLRVAGCEGCELRFEGLLVVGGDTREDQLYSDATRAINESRWSEAEPLLDQVYSLRGRRSDGALYWMAYVRNKEGRPSDALQACSQSRQNYPRVTG